MNVRKAAKLERIGERLLREAGFMGQGQGAKIYNRFDATPGKEGHEIVDAQPFVANRKNGRSALFTAPGRCNRF
ncbi:MAG: hypothetical protein FWD77_05735 [Betaproteobacteria bacterium]|nr:hypothetical protein [Betaproteobacteria bacterium]